MPDLRVVYYREENLWIAQVLEHDIRAQAASLPELRQRLDAAIAAERRESLERHGEEFRGIDPAPAHFFKMWKESAGSFRPSDHEQERPYQVALYG